MGYKGQIFKLTPQNIDQVMAVLKTHNKRIIELLSEAKHSGKVKTDKDWCKKVGINNANLSAIRAGKRDFTLEQMISASKLVGVSLDWITGRTTAKYIIKKPKLIDLLKEAIALAEEKS